MSNYIDQVNKYIHQEVSWAMDMAWDNEGGGWNGDILAHNEQYYINKETDEEITQQDYEALLKLCHSAAEERNENRQWEQRDKEVLAYLVVSHSLGYYLKDHGYAIYITPLGMVWGRETANQASFQDSIIQDFAIDKLGFKKEDIKF